MIRKLILSAVLATGTVAGVTATSAPADAAPVDHDRDRDFRGVRFEVQVRHRGHRDTYGTYRDRDEARPGSSDAGASGSRRADRSRTQPLVRAQKGPAAVSRSVAHSLR
jgi:hypothetical protein